MISPDQLVRSVAEARALIGQVRYHDWTITVDDEPNGYGPTSMLRLFRTEPDSNDPSRDVDLLNTMPLLFPLNAGELMQLVWIGITQGEDHERLEQLRCIDGHTIFAAHDVPDTQPPVGKAFLRPDPQTLHLL